MKTDLAKKKCVPCEGGIPALTKAQIEKLMPDVKGWKLANGKLQKTWKFSDFVEASSWLEKVKFLAEAEGHHPDIHWYWNTITLELITHAINGLSENDFILASKINKLK
ncbi:MAG: 4a-hydroxytetrahydrobiopterin dehydratase [Candidatus Woesearchaeota archaeon]